MANPDVSNIQEPRWMVKPRQGSWLVALLAGGLLLLPVPAQAVVSCGFSAGTATVTMGANDTATLARGGAGQINVNGAPCGAATVLNTDTIVVHGAGGAETLVVDLSGGPFEPGATAEGSGVSEIEFSGNLAGGTDNFRITGSSGAENLNFGSFGLNLNGDDDVDVTIAGAETFTVNAGDGDDVVSGAGGDVTGAAFPLSLTLNGEGGADTLTGGAAGDTITGGVGDDAFNGGAGNDVLLGEDGNDTVDGGPGNDALSGMAGTDTALYASASSGVTVNLATGSSSGGGGIDSLASVENATGSLFADTLVGDDTANVLDGAGSADTLRGAGDDDSLLGGEGSDTADYSTAPSPVNANLGAGTASGDGSDVLSSVENVIGSDFGDTLTGNSANNNLQGGAGNDTLAGNGGDDVLAGGAGSDLLDEGSEANGSDDLSGGSGSDTVSYGKRSQDLVVSINGDFDDGAPGESDNVATDVENVVTGSGDDVVTGEGAGNRLETGAGDDFLTGAGGDDVLDGGPGRDVADYFTASSGVSVDLSTGRATGGAGNDVLMRIEDLVGSTGNDVLRGNDEDNEILGHGGIDTINGGRGHDELYGGQGDDELRGRRGNDRLRGDADNDHLAGGPGKDRLNGGPGFNTCNGGPGRDRMTGCRRKLTFADLI
jgi:Ca2+-binding RTX toxin-like protein